MPKTAHKEPSLEQLKEELKELETGKNKAGKDAKLKELARTFAGVHKWDLALEAFQYIEDEKERNLLITDLIEEFLLPGNEINQAKKFAKYLTPSPEIQPLVLIRIALAESDRAQARQIAEKLPSPLSRNYAYIHIIESYLAAKENENAREIGKLIKENVRTIFDAKSRSYVLREVALNLYLAHNDKEQAREAAELIPDETIRNQVMNKIIASK